MDMLLLFMGQFFFNDATFFDSFRINLRIKNLGESD